VLIPVEGVRTARLALGTASAAPLSLGLWVKAHRTGTYSGALRNSAKNRSYPFTFAVSSADTWEFKTLSVGGDTSGTWLADTGVGLSLNICVAGGSSRTGTAGAWGGSDYSGAASTTNGVAATSDTFQITGVIVLPGIELPAADRAALVMRPADHELSAPNGCRRYLQRLDVSSSFAAMSMSGLAYSTTQAYVPWRLDPLMRTAPQVSASTLGNLQIQDATGLAIALTGLTAVVVHPERALLRATVASGLVAGNATFLGGNNMSPAWLQFDARL